GYASELPGKDVLVFELRQMIELQKKEISRLREQQLSAENTVAKMEIERNQMYKTLVANHELALQRKVSSHSEEVKRKNEEIDSLKATLHKLHESVVYQSVGNVADAIANNDTERKYTTAYENSLLGRVPVEMKECCSVASKLIDSQDDGAVSSVLNDLSKGYLLKSFTVSRGMIFWGLCTNYVLEICKSKLMLIMPAATNMTQSSEVKSEERDSERDENTDDELRVQADSDEDIAPVTVRPATVQTVISLREMRTMITVQDIHEYCAVLIVWSEPHNAYILFRLIKTCFSVSPIFHFVKESSLKRMGVKWDRQSVSAATVGQRPNWLMAVTTRLELCKIRKTDNRYNLKVGTKFYRVEVEPLQIDSSSIRRQANE
ncbi:hypothetical protein WUBG_05015, partial [Wuchereria bancrofti]